MTQTALSMLTPLFWTKPRASLENISPIDHLFNRLDGIYPGTWRAKFPNDDSIENWKREWTQGFCEDQIDANEISVALKACRYRGGGFTPSLGEFIKLCRPWMNPEIAYHIALDGVRARINGKMGQWPHPAVFWAAIKVGTHDLLNIGWQTIRVRWENALSEQMSQCRWGDIELPKSALAHHHSASEQGQTTLEEAQAFMHKLKEKTGMDSMGDPKNGPKAWAYKIQARVDKGESVPFAVQQCAQRALGLIA